MAYVSSIVMQKFYTEVGEVKLQQGIKKVFKLNTSHFYSVGDFITKESETKFEEIFQIELKPTQIPNHQQKYMNVEGVKVPDSYKGRNIATLMYRYFIKELKFNILGDETQFFGARKLWAKLSKMNDLIVDIIDFRDGTFLEKDVIIHHGLEDWDFDDRVWSYNVDKKNIRLILREIL